MFYYYLDSIPIPKEDLTFLKKVHADLVVKDVVNDLHTCNFDKYVKNSKLLIYIFNVQKMHT